VVPALFALHSLRSADRAERAQSGKGARLMRGLVAEFAQADRLLSAAAGLRERGYQRIDAYTPFAVHGLEEALGLRRSLLPWLVFRIVMCVVFFAFIVQWYGNAPDYPLTVGGRPPFAAPAFIPITFETGVLAAAGAAFFGLFWVTRLPRLSHPLFEVTGF